MNNIKLIKDRNKAKSLFKEYEAFIVLINQMTIERRVHYDKMQEEIDLFDKKELREFTDKIKSEISRMRNLYGVKVPNSFMVDILEDIKSEVLKNEKKICYVAKFKLKEIFKNYHKAMLDFNELPEHSKIGIDIGLIRKKPEVESFILEAAIFEDMCAIFNLLKQKLTEYDINKMRKVDIKTIVALMRTVVLTSFNFIEAYLNGIASDFFFANFNELDDDTRIILTEWDHIKSKPRYLSLRDKALKYIRIACKMSYPPLQENNCEELAFIIERVKDIRDSIVHPSSIHALGNKEVEILRLTMDEVEGIIDTSIKLVQKIEQLVYGNNNRKRWIFERAEDGFFPEEAFF